MSEKKIIKETAEQAVESSEKFAEEIANQTENLTASEEQPKAVEQVVVKKGGSGIGLLALLVALGVGGAGYYFGSQKLNSVESQLQAFAQKASQVQVSNSTENTVDLSQEKAQIASLESAYSKAKSQIEQLLQEQSAYGNQIVALQAQIQRLSNAAPQADTAQ